MTGTGLRYLFEIFAARRLGVDLFGLFFLGLAVLKICEVLSTAGLHRGVLRFIAVHMGEHDTARTKGDIIFSLRTTLLISILLAAGIFLAARPLSHLIFHKPGLVPVLQLFSLAVPFTAVTTILLFSTQGFKLMQYRVYVRELFEPGARIILLGLALILGLKLFGAVGAFALSLVLGTPWAVRFARKVFPPLLDRSIRPITEGKRLMRFSWPLLMAEFISLLVIWINILMIGSFRTSGEVGIYSAAHRTALLGQMILISFNAVFSPIIADLFNQGRIERLRRLYRIIVKWILTLTLPITIVMVIAAPQILEIFGKNFRDGALCLVLLSSAQLINSVFGSSGFMIMMTGRSRLTLINNIILIALNIGLNLLWIPSLGIAGAALSFLVSVAVINLALQIEVWWMDRIHPFRSDWFKPVAAAAAAAGVTMSFRHLALPPLSSPWPILLSLPVIFGGVYIGMLLLFRLEPEDRFVLDAVLNRIRRR